jgi:uncharacterized protein (DUF433 family)
MRGIQNPDIVNPRIEGSRIRVSNILFALQMDSPVEQFERWGLEEYQVYAAIQHYWMNKDNYSDWLEEKREEYDATTVDELDDAIESWSGFSDTVIQFEDAAGVGRDCPDCGSGLETDWNDYTLVCKICDQKYKSEEITVLWRAEDYE